MNTYSIICNLPDDQDIYRLLYDCISIMTTDIRAGGTAILFYRYSIAFSDQIYCWLSHKKPQ